MDLGPHAAFIWASFGIVTVLMLAIAVWLIFDGRRQSRLLADLEARGIRRRSESAPARPSGTV